MTAVPPRPRATTRIADLPRAFWWLWTAELIIWIGRFVVPFMSIFLTGHEGMTAGAAGLVVSGYGAGMMISSLGGGMLADRFGRKRVAAVSLGASAGILVAIPFAPGLPATIALLVLYGLANGACQPIVVTLIGDIVPAAHRRMAFNYNAWAVNLGYAIGPIIAGALAQRHVELLFHSQAALMLLALVVLLARVPEGLTLLPAPTSPAAAEAARAEATDPGAVHSPPTAEATARPVPRRAEPGLAAVLRDRPFVVFTLLMFVYAMVYVQSTTTLPMVMTQQGLSSAQYGYLLTANGLLLCLLQIPAARLLGRWSAEIVIGVSLLVTAVGVGVQAAAASMLFYLGAVCIWTLGELGSHAQAQSLAADMARPDRRARYQGVYALHFSLATVVGPMLGGLVLEHLGATALWLLAGATSAVVAGGLLLTRSGRARRLEATAAWIDAQAAALVSPAAEGRADARPAATEPPAPTPSGQPSSPRRSTP